MKHQFTETIEAMSRLVSRLDALQGALDLAAECVECKLIPPGTRLEDADGIAFGLRMAAKNVRDALSGECPDMLRPHKRHLYRPGWLAETKGTEP